MNKDIPKIFPEYEVANYLMQRFRGPIRAHNFKNCVRKTVEQKKELIVILKKLKKKF